MKKHNLPSRMLSFLLAFAMLLGFAVPLRAAEEGAEVSFQEVENSKVSGSLLEEVPEEETDAPVYRDTDVVRVSIFLERASTLDAGYSTQNIARNAAAMSYRDGLKLVQKAMTASIERATGEELDVQWNLTLAANAISANVEYGQIATIEQVPGVEKVVLETRYEPQEDAPGEAAEPNMTVSTQMTGANMAWESGYTGAGMRIAIIDTGLDIKHQSVDTGAFRYALEENAREAGMTYDAYAASLNLLDKAQIAAVLDELHVTQRGSFTADELYISEKLPFGFSYVDNDLDVTHENDSMTEHGSHVGGIAAANRFIPKDGEYVSAAQAVGVVGNAPDAQILVMKVFGNNGGAYDSDYMVAIEDAMMLGCDSVNLSLGSANPGSSIYFGSYGETLEAITESDTVVSISMGNSGTWAEHARNTTGLPYVDYVNFHTGGSPGSYTTPLTVASVDNDGAVSNVFEISGRKFNYSETGEFNKKLVSLDTSADKSGTEYDYVLLDAIGKSSDYQGIDVEGKVVFVSRGETTFVDKVREASYKGARALVVYNNEPGSILMDLSDYYGSLPAVSITQEDGQWIKEQSASAQTEEGVTYYTGKILIDQSVATIYNGSEYLIMSSFSSWGVPGDLSLKPEITAPGGNICSINGTHSTGYTLAGGTNQYEVMSGTSMAAPQVTGIAALVLQAIGQRGLSQDGLTDRALAQSLMMSTATPLKDANGNYYSLLRQGAGMVNASAATGANSYVLVKGQEDGKVKAELGDDPEREGVYTFSFTLNNLEDAEKRFVLSAELFTQAVVEGYANSRQNEDETALFQSVSTVPLMAMATWSADGQLVNNAGVSDNWDFNGDGKTDADDAQTLLDFTTGVRDAIENEAYADLNGDGKIDTYDVHVLLNRLGRDNITLPAGGSVEITVTLRLTDAQKQELDALCTGGAFIQGFVYVNALGDAEGVLGTSHSIPMLSYYGSWTDSSMYDVGSYQEFSSGDEIRATYLGNEGSNTFAVIYGDEEETSYYFGGNPMLPDEIYMPQRNAINSERGDMISYARISPIRNAIDSRFLVTQDEKTLYESTFGPVDGAFYYVNGYSWQNTTANLRMNWKPTGFAEGERFEIGIDLAPELYLHGDRVDWDALGEGAKLRVPVCIDNTDPILEGISLDLMSNTLVITASDNQYVSAAVLYNSTGTKALAYTGAVQDAVPGETYDYVLDLTGVSGKKFLVQVSDYALNTVTYMVELQVGEAQPVPEVMIFALDESAWLTFDLFRYDPYGIQTVADVSNTIIAASAVNQLVYMATDKAQLYVAPLEDLSDMVYVSQLPALVLDMAYNPTNGTLYGITENNDLIEIDQILGDTTTIGRVTIPTNTLAVDPDGNFYCNYLDRGLVFTFNLDNVVNGVIMANYFLRSSLSDTQEGGTVTHSMEWNPNTGKLYWFGSYQFEWFGMPQGYGFFFEIDTENATFERYNPPRYSTGALVITEQSKSGSTAPTDQVTDVQVSCSAMTIHRGLTRDLDASVRPWFTTDRTVTWSSSDENIAVVDQNGLVTAVDAGTCEIRATSNLDPTKVGVCTVTVDMVDLKLEGVLKDAEGKTKLFTWDLAGSKTWQAGLELETAINSVTSDGNNTLFLNDAVTDPGKIYEIDKATGEIRNTYENYAEEALWDMVYSAYTSTADAPKIGGVWKWIFMVPAAPEEIGVNYFNLQNSTAPLFGVTSLGYEEIEDVYGSKQDAEHFVMLDGDKDIIELWCYQVDGTVKATSRVTPTDLDITFRIYEDENKRSSLVCDEAGNLYLSFFNGKSNDIYSLTYSAQENIYKSELLTNMGSGIWPAALYKVESGAAVRNGDVVTPQSEGAVTLTAETASVEALMDAVEENSTPTGSLNAATGAGRTPMEPAAVEHETACADKTVTLSLTADDVTTNGLVTVAYDASKLSLADKSGKADLNSFVDGEGLVTFGYAYKEGVPAGTVLATLTFKAESDTEAAFTVTKVQENEAYPGTAEKITLTVPEHDYATTVVEPTCETGGYTLHTCVNCGASYQSDLTEALGHTWGAWTVTTEAGCFDTGIETRICSVCGKQETRETATDAGNCPSKTFQDLDTNRWYHRYVDYVLNNGLMKGMGTNLFAPEDTLSRGMLVTTLYRLAGEPEVTEKSGFEDVDENRYYGDAVAWAQANGIGRGVTDTCFCPDAPVTREQAATFLYRYVTVYLEAQPVEGADLTSFTDSGEISRFAGEALAWAAAEGIFEGFPDGTLQPQGALTRAQMAKLLTILDQKF